ncbi:dynamin family protein [Cereibacter johrii]|uniref:Dynamin family protein n=1 Tax=Cereibacter johrii TaxID=445629 RepID=A0ABX5J479_9RHOB|nr:dynamin family protein [Cereibacter johrii]PTM77165.1 dynamin family protein [Cereibacter johrii]
MEIGALQRTRIAALRRIVADIEEAAGREARAPFERLRLRFDGWTARVAVIGQVKAGKSSFLNAFIGAPGLLPSDVNPWTSAVTNLRINLPGDPAGGACFRFFDEAAWEEIVEGDPRVRALAEEMLPGFDSGLLLRQAQEMKARAQARLGPAYGGLLGRAHRYDSVTPELLQAYVCAGPGADAGLEDSGLGLYSAITREADLYMHLPEFAVPVVLTDTPGVNDPFLVRDEVTCRSLDRADIFVILLSAHQPLTEADLALLRMLPAERARNVILVLNRIDELDEMDAEIEPLLSDVAARLRAALPAAAAISILPGSAWLAELALREDAEARALRAEADGPALRRYLLARYGRVPETEAGRLRLASGVEEVKRTLGRLIDLGAGHRQLAALHEEVRAETGALVALCKRERRSVAQQVESMSGPAAAGFLTEIRGEMARLSELRRGIEERLARLTPTTDRILARGAATLRQTVETAIRAFLEERRCELAARAAAGDRRPVPVDLARLGRLLDRDLSEDYRRTRSAADEALAEALAEAAGLASKSFPGVAAGVSLHGLPHEEFATTLTLARRPLTVDMIARRGWAFWRGAEADPARTFEALRRITLAELLPWSQKILAAATEAQALRIETGKERIGILLATVDRAMAERAERLRSDAAVLAQLAADPVRAAQMSNRLQSRMEVLERRLQVLAICDSRLAHPSLADAA